MTSLLDKNGLIGMLLLVLCLVVILVVTANLGHQVPPYPRAIAREPVPAGRPPIHRLEPMFSPGTLSKLSPLTNPITAFHTAYFQPPPPRPVTTRKADFTYRGFFETAEKQKRAFVQVDDQLLVGAIGAKLVADLVVTDIGLRNLVVTNSRAQSNVLEFNAKKQMEIPAP